MEQPHLKALAEKVLRRNKQWNNRAPTTEKTVEHPPQKSTELVPCVNEPTKPSKNTDLGALLAEACQGVEGIDPAVFRALLSPKDVEDIEAGHIPTMTLNAYAKSFAEGIRAGRIKLLAAAISKVALPSRVRCGECLRFERDTIDAGTGIGRCVIGGEGTGSRHPALWANAERECKDFEAI